MIVSTFVTRSLEEIIGVASEAWMQLYFYLDLTLAQHGFMLTKAMLSIT